jgi:hypothetical protein
MTERLAGFTVTGASAAETNWVGFSFPKHCVSVLDKDTIDLSRIAKTPAAPHFHREE